MPKRSVQPEDLLRLAYLGDPQISPDGKRVLFQKKTVGEKHKYETALWVTDLAGHLRQPTAVEGGAAMGRWSPDGTRIAFVSGREKPSSQILLLDTGGGEASALTKLPEGSIGGIRWSPDSKAIAFTFRPQRPELAEEAKKKREEAGRSEPPKVVESARYRLDGDGYYLQQRYAVHVVDVATGTHRETFGGCPMDAYSFDWSPDSKRLAITRSMVTNPWREPENVQISIVDLEGHAELLVGPPLGDKYALRWSPAGKSLAFLGRDDPNDHRGVKNTRLFVVPVSGGPTRCLTADTDYNLDTPTLSDAGESGDAYLEWAPNSKSLYVRLGLHGEAQLASVDAKSGKLSILTEGQHVLSIGPPSRDGKSMGCLWSDPTHPAEVAVVNLESPAPEPELLTRINAALLDEIELAEPEEHWVEAPDGYKVHTWLLRPPGANLETKYPAVLEIHGGPQAQYGWVFFHEFQVLASAGYVVVYSNPRGGKGYGEKHSRAIDGHWGSKDWEDVAAVKDWMKTLPFVDPARIGVMGGSYGGYMVNWAVGHTNDFKAAITDRCVSNLVSKSGNSDYAYHHGTYWKGQFYGGIDEIKDLWRDSPIAYFDQVRTPMLIIHSEGDLRCNIEQSEQVFMALQTRGIESRFVRYPASTSHGMSRAGPPDLRVHRLKQILEWWERRL